MTNARSTLRSAAVRSLRRRPPFLSIILLFVALTLFVWPTAMIITGAFRSGSVTTFDGWSLDALHQVYSSPRARGAIRTSGVMAMVMPPISVTLAFYFAWIVTRTNTPFRRLVTPTMVLILALPNLFLALSWALFGNENSGMLNEIFRAVTSSTGAIIDIESLFGVLLVGSLKLTALAYFLLVGGMSSMSMSLEEAASMSGAGRFRTLFGINLPVMGPAYVSSLVLCIIISLQFFETPLLLGTPANVRVIATEIFSYLNDLAPPQYGQASAITLVLLVCLIGLLALQRLVLRRRDYRTVEGKGVSTERWDLGRWKWLGTVIFGTYAILTLVFPLSQLALTSFQPFLGARGQFTLANYEQLLTGFGHPRTYASLMNTAILGILGGLIVMVLALGVVYISKFGPRMIGRLVSQSTWLPWALPGTALALGILWVVFSTPALSQFYGSLPLMLVALVILAIPIAMRTIESAVQQIDPGLQESAWMSGASRGRAFLQIVVKLIVPSLLSGWVLTGILIAGNLAIPVLLGSTTLNTVPRLTYDLYIEGETTVAAAFSCLFLLCLVAGVILLWGMRRVTSWGLRRESLHVP